MQLPILNNCNVFILPESEQKFDLIEVVPVRLGEDIVEGNELLDTLQGIFSGNIERALRHVPQMSEPDEKEVVDMLMMSSYSEKKGEKTGMILTIKISRAIEANPTWTDEQIAEHCSCSVESVKNYKEALAAV